MTPPAEAAWRSRRDLVVLLLIRSLRAFGFGASAVTVTLHLEHRGLSRVLIGVTPAIGLGSASLSGLGLAIVASRVGRRTALALSGLLMAIAGADLAFAPEPWLLVLAGLTGMLGLATIDLDRSRPSSRPPLPRPPRPAAAIAPSLGTRCWEPWPQRRGAWAPVSGSGTPAPSSSPMPSWRASRASCRCSSRRPPSRPSEAARSSATSAHWPGSPRSSRSTRSVADSWPTP